jgi:hypothetical protein
MAASIPVTLASDDTLTAAANAILTTIDTDTGAMVTDLAAIEVLQTTIAGDTTSIDGKITACNTGAVVISSGTVTTVSAVTAITNELPAGTQNIGDVDVATIAAGSALIGDVGVQPRTSGGLSVFNDNDLDETAVVVKAAAGQIYSIHAVNLDATPIYLQLWNIAQGSVTVGTTAPTMEFVIPSQGDANGAGFTISWPHGIAFDTAITAAATTTTEGAGGPGANEVHVVIGFK